MIAEQYQQLAHTIPQQPGIYKYYDSSNELIYVGKAKNLRKRTASYFSKTFVGQKTHELVKRIHHIEFTIVDNEHDAFLLENALIKEYQPKYNINLKDDKSYPYIVIKREPFPRVFITRKKIKDGSEYIGPFTNALMIRELLLFIKQMIPLRTCKLALTDNNINRGKFKVCLEYHLGNCKGPCEGLQDKDDYQEGIQQIKDIVKGNLSAIIQQFKGEMQEYAAALQFEKAEMMKKKIENLQNYQSRSVVISHHLSSMDVFSILKEDDTAYINYLMVQNGTIIQTHTIKVEAKIEEQEEDILCQTIFYFREMFNSNSSEIIVPYIIDYPDEQMKITVPKTGDKKKLLDLSVKNVNYYKEEIRKRKILRLEGKSDMEKLKVLYQLQQDLQLSEVPRHIECFDNSNFQGSYPVSAMVCFKEGEPSKKDYRHFNVKTVEGINDFATMKEAVYRRYKRLKEENQPLPQLIIIDGGKGQLGSAVEALNELGMMGRMNIVGLAKNEEELFFPGDMQSVKLEWDSDGLKFIRRVRDEVHRFGITFHRNQRSKGTFKNELEAIKGIGENTATELLKAFKSVKSISVLEVEDIAKIIGKSKAQMVFDHFHTGL